MLTRRRHRQRGFAVLHNTCSSPSCTEGFDTLDLKEAKALLDEKGILVDAAATKID